MRFNDFIAALYAAGWRAPNDAQHAKIKLLWAKCLWAKLYPVSAQLENEISEFQENEK